MQKLIARHDKLILESLEDDEQVVGNIIIPDTGKEKTNTYRVLQVGPGRFNEVKGEGYIPMETQIGDLVIIPKALVASIQFDGKEYFTTREVEVRAYIIETE